MDDLLRIAGRSFHSRLLLGTGKFSSPEVMKQAIAASGSEVVTVALRRVELENPDDSILDAIDRDRYFLLPNTSGARDATEAVRLEDGTLFKTINTYIHFWFKSGDRDFDGGLCWAFGGGGSCPCEGYSERRAGRKNLMFLINVPFFHVPFFHLSPKSGEDAQA